MKNRPTSWRRLFKMQRWQDLRRGTERVTKHAQRFTANYQKLAREYEARQRSRRNGE